MKILFVRHHSSATDYGGGSINFRGLAKKMSERGHDVAVFHEREPADGYRWFRANPMDAFRAAAWADVIHFRFKPESDDPGRMTRSFDLMRRIFQVPVTWEIHGIAAEAAMRKGLDEKEAQDREKRSLLRKNAQRVDVALCVSRELQAYARESLEIRDTIYRPNAADILTFSPNTVPTENIPLDPQVPVILWTGTGTKPWDGDRLAVRLAQRLHAKNIPCQVVLIGNRRAELGSLPPNTIHLGNIPHQQIPNYTSAADILLCLYDLTPFGKYGFYHSPVKLYEYMASGKAILGTRVGEIIRAIDHGKDGWLVGTDMEDICSAAQHLLANPKLRDSLGQAARSKAESTYNWDRIADQTEAAFAKALVKNH